MYNELNTKVSNLENIVLDTTTLIHINQYNADKKNLEKKLEDVHKKIPDVIGLGTSTVFDTKIGEVERKKMLVV